MPIVEKRTPYRQSQSSTLNAGQNLSITATGKNKDSNPDSGNITVVGSELKAGKDLSLSATQDINLVSAQNTEQTTSQNSSKGSSVGVGVGVGAGGYGVNVSASVNSQHWVRLVKTILGMMVAWVMLKSKQIPAGIKSWIRIGEIMFLLQRMLKMGLVIKILL